jgi:hypothetical protein
MRPIIALALVHLPLSSRDLTESQEAEIGDTIDRGTIQSIIIEPESFLVLDGARRVTVARKLGVEYLPYSFGRLHPKPGWGTRIERIQTPGHYKSRARFAI